MEDILKFNSYEEEISHDSFILVSRFLSEVSLIMSKKSIKKKDLAALLGMKAPHVTKVFNGDKLPNIEFLAKLQKALGVRFEIRAVPLSNVNNPEKKIDTVPTKIVSVSPDSSLEISLKSSWSEKSAYCKAHGISISDLDKKLKGK